jgi:formate hydrogenlyase subunit 3/multisubunit Na+/H+ antiporter MnhD subunit
MDYDLLLLIALLVVPSLGLGLAGFILRKKENRRFATLVVFLLFLFALTTVADTFFVRVGTLGREVLGWPIFLVRDAISTIVALLFAFRFFPSYIFGSGRSADYSHQFVLHDAVCKVP